MSRDRRQTELRELEREVSLDAGRGNLLDERDVSASGGVGGSDCGDALTKIIQRHREAAGLQRSRRGDRLADGLAGNEAAGKAPRVAHAVAGGEAFERWTAGERMENSLGDGTEHQWVRMGRLGARRC